MRHTKDNETETTEHSQKMGFSEMLESLKPVLNWKISMRKNDKVVFQQVDKTYFEEIPEEMCRMLVRTHFETATPSTVASLAKAITEDSKRLFDEKLFLGCRENVVGFLNGVFDMRSGKMRKYQSSDFVVNPLPHKIPYELSKDTEKEFVKTLKTWVGEETGDWFLNTLAYMLFIYPNSENIWLNFFGSGANGKSVCLELLERILGDDKVIGADLASMSRFSGYDFQDKWLVLGRDSSVTVADSATAFIKNYTGDLKFRSEKKGGSACDVMNPGKLIVSTNGLIQSKDRSYGWYRRLLPIPFPNQFSRNEKFKQRLFQDMPKLIRVMLHRAYMYKHSETSIFDSVPKPVQNLLNETRMMNDRLTAFWELDFCGKQIDEGTFLDWDKLRAIHGKTMTEVYEVYKDWHCREFGETAIEPSLKTFGGQYGAFLSGPAGKYFCYRKTRAGRVVELLPQYITGEKS